MRTIALVSLFACFEESKDDWQQQTVADSGSACLVTNADPGAAQTFDASTPIEVQVTFDVCLSSSCSRNAAASCAVEVDGSLVTITGEGSWEENVGENVACTDDCGFLQATCDLSALPDGDYTVRFGAESFALTVPGTQDACAGDWAF